jgi:hypothetical protein
MGLYCLMLIFLSGGKQENLQARFPSLLDATLEQLGEGLSKGLFTSVDLVKVPKVTPLYYSYCSNRRVGDQLLSSKTIPNRLIVS